MRVAGGTICSGMRLTTRTVQVRCDVPNEDGRLMPEMYAIVTFELGEEENVLALPNEAIQYVEGEPTAFVGEEGARFRARPLRLGRRAGSFTKVEGGIAPGDRVVVKGAFLVKSELLKRYMAAD